jgi:ParB family transcriptional regulator, chromosome partitioning protein
MEDRLAREKTTEKRRALGRGLDSLLPAGPRVVAAPPVVGNLTPLTSAAASVDSLAMPPDMPSEVRREAGERIVPIALDHIDENPYQTRRIFDSQTLETLADSIRSNGVVQPVVVRRSTSDRFVLILGERRCRAARLAGHSTIPALIRQVSNQQAAEMTVIENLQRQDLNCLEQAHAFARLSREFGLTQEQIGQRTGCSRESVSNYMRLLKLPPDVQQLLADGKLGFSEARVLLQLANPDSIPHFAKEAAEKQLSVAQLAALVNYANLPGSEAAGDSSRARWVDPNVRAIQTSLEQILGCKVRISDRKGKGKILIEYANLEDFDRIVEMLKGKQHI